MKIRSWLIILLILIVVASISYFSFMFSVVEFEDYGDYDSSPDKAYFISSTDKSGNWTSSEYTYQIEGPPQKQTVYNLNNDKWATTSLGMFDVGETYYWAKLCSADRAGDCDSSSNIVYKMVTSDASRYTSNPGQTFELYTKEDFANRDFKITLNCVGNSCIFEAGDKKSNIFSDNVQGTNTYEFFASRLVNGRWDIHKNGVDFKTIENGDRQLYLQFFVSKSSFTIESLGFKIPYETCSRNPDELLMFETFVGEKDISLYSLSYPAKKFCLEHPVALTTATGSDSDRGEIYNALSKGEIVKVPADTTMTIAYTTKITGNINIGCGDTGYDVNLKSCKIPQMAYKCNEGLLDEATGVCVNVENFCGEGGRISVLTDGSKKCIFNIPIQAACECGEYNSLIAKCSYASEGACDCGYTKNEELKTCEGKPLQIIVCRASLYFNPQTGCCTDGSSLCEKPITSLKDGCPKGYELTTDSVGKYICVDNIQESKCPVGSSYSTSENKCVVNTSSLPQWIWFLGIAIFIIIVTLIIIIIKIKR